MRKRKRTTEFIIDETMIKIGSNYMWIWVAIEPESKEILGISVSKERNMLIAEHFISSLTKGYVVVSIQYLEMAVPGIHKPVSS